MIRQEFICGFEAANHSRSEVRNARAVEGSYTLVSPGGTFLEKGAQVTGFAVGVAATLLGGRLARLGYRNLKNLVGAEDTSWDV